jgi:hypothetical protein
MATKNTKETEKAAPSAVADVPPAPNEGRATSAPTGARPRVAGKLAKPVYLIHRGKFTTTIPEVTRERVITDPDDKDFGSVVEEVVVDAYEVSGKLPKDARFGNRKIGVVHEVWDAEERDAMVRRGFETATEAELDAHSKSAAKNMTLDQIAAAERVRAQKNLRRMGRVPMSTMNDDEEEA